MQRSTAAVGLTVFLSIIMLGHLRHGTADATQRLALTRSLIFHQSVITEEYGAIKYAPLQSVAMIPPYALGFLVGTLIDDPDGGPDRVAYRFCAYLFTPLVVAAVSMVFLALVREMTADARLALVATFFMVFGSLLLPYSRLMFSEPLNALLMILVFRAVTSFEATGSLPSAAALATTLGLLVLNNAVFAPLMIGVLTVEVLRVVRAGRAAPSRRLIWAGIASCSVTAGVWMLYNHARYGSVTELGYANEGFSGSLVTGVYGLLLSIGRGLLIYSPLTVLCLLFLLANPHLPESIRHRRTLRVFMILFTGYLLIYGSWHSFEGGWCWGPRFLLPFVPVLHLAFPALLQRVRIAPGPVRAAFLLLAVGAVGLNAWEHVGGYIEYEERTFLDGTIPYRLSVFVPEFSPILNCWDPDHIVPRLLRFLLGASLSWALLAHVLPRACRSTDPIQGRRPARSP